MSEEPLQRAEQAIEEGRKAAAAAPVMPFDDGPSGATPEQTGGAVAAHGDDEVASAETQVGATSTEEGRSANAEAERAAQAAAEREQGDA
jgi:hypothetical protein